MSINPKKGERLSLFAPLSETYDRYAAIFDAVSDGIIISDPITGSIVEVNEPGCAMFGYLRSELLGCSVDILSSDNPPYTRNAAVELQRKALLGHPQLFEWECKGKNGTTFWVEISIRHTKIEQYPVMVAIVRNVSERKQLITDLNHALKEMSAASAAKSAFFANMSHELRTPLNAIIGFSDLMLKQSLGPLGSLKYHEYIGDIQDSGVHLLGLINDILDLSRLNAGMLTLVDEVVDIRIVIHEACKMAGALAKRGGVRINVVAARDVPMVYGDARRIKQILINLLTNAIKFTARPGTVTISAGVTVNGLMLKVRDTGIGISEANQKTVFEQFRQVDSRLSRMHDGSGLGLPLVKQLVELHGGTIAIQSEEGVGTTIEVLFPSERVLKAAIGGIA
ncbi:MAG: PAS domain-containing sensor histidine kinase [Nitrosospira sp.]